MIDRRTRILRWIFRRLGWLLLRLLTRTRITGREYLNTAGPVIFAANHTSTFDALLLITLLPPDTMFVGPGDFKLLWPAN
jgi:1-acyl-sn-glycerol-3-phosphate acyltransferase